MCRGTGPLGGPVLRRYEPNIRPERIDADLVEILD